MSNPTGLENFRNALTPEGILPEGSTLPPNNPDWGDDFRACCTPTGIKIAGSSKYEGKKNLSDKYTIQQLSAKVQAGNFEGIRIGDYITREVKVDLS